MQSSDKPFPSALFSDGSHYPVHLCELMMRRVSYTIRSKPDWWTKYKDPAIRQKWTEECLAAQYHDITLEPEHVEYLLAELEMFDKARIQSGTAHIQPSIQRGFWESDNLIQPELKAKLDNEIAKLRDVPEEDKDWHPGSDQQVLDLVHPSMYCVRYGSSVTRTGEVAQPPEPRTSTWERTEEEDESLVAVPTLDSRRSHFGATEVGDPSSSTAWLPTDFEIASHGKVTAWSYINNVHPGKQGALHNALSSALEAMVPMFSRCLADLRNGQHHLRIMGEKQCEIDTSKQPIDPSTGHPVEYFYEDRPEEEEELTAEEEEMGFDIGQPKIWREWMLSKPYIDPTPEPFALPKIGLGEGYSLNGRTVQVITKIAEICLTPEKPTYAGGSWHVEGMLNESIVATGIYYLAEENIAIDGTKQAEHSKLAFRLGLGQELEAELPYEQNDPFNLLLASYGLCRDCELNQQLGDFETREGRTIVFPNVYQHAVDSFKLADPSRPGKRTIVAFFLCDPTYRIYSTSDIPPQREDWLKAILYGQSKTPSRLLSMPNEIKDKILDQLKRDGAIIDREGAEKAREELMEERSSFVEEQNERYFEAAFNLCEH